MRRARYSNLFSSMKSILVSIPLLMPTPEAVQNLNGFIESYEAVCKKENIPEDKCVESGKQVLDGIRHQVHEICQSHFPNKEECFQS